MEQPAHAAPLSFCRLRAATGRVEACPADGCAFWEPGSAALEGRCAFEQVDVAGRPALASLLLRIRTKLERTGVQAHEAGARRHDPHT